MLMYRRWMLLALAAVGVAIIVALIGCGGGAGSTGGGPIGSSSGTLRVAITDQSGYGSVVIAIREVRVVPEGGEESDGVGLPLIASFDPPMVVDVMQLSYEQLVVGEAVVPDGTYSQLRLVLAPNENGSDPVNYATLADDPETLIPLRTPSGQQSGLKIIGSFDVVEGDVNTIVLDFDPARAIVTTGNGRRILKPTGIRLTQVDDVEPVYGALAGTVLPAEAWATAQVEAVPEGATDPAATASVSPEDGTFRIPLPDGDYTIRVTAEGYETLDTATGDTPQVFTVVEEQDTVVGELTLTPVP